MRNTIRLRVLVPLNLLVIGVGIAAGWGGISVVRETVEQRLLREPVANAARLVGQMGLPLTDSVLERLRAVLGNEVLAVPAAGGPVLGSSLSTESREALAAQLRQRPSPGFITLGGRGFRVASASVAAAGSSAADAAPVRLYMLLPNEQLQAAKRRAAGRIAGVTLAAIVLATALGWWLATSIAQPVRTLADQMDRLSAAADDGRARPLSPADRSGPVPGAVDALPGPPPDLHGPEELVRLARSFRELLDRLTAARSRLAQTERLAALGQVSAAVVHELRNPLSGIRMNTRVLADELAARGRSDRSLELIAREIERMDLYLAELLSLAKDNPSVVPSAQEVAAPAHPVRLDQVVESVTGLVSGRFRHAGVTLETVRDRAAPLVNGEQERLRQVVMNLLVNALEATPEGGRVTVGTAVRDGDRVRLFVRDSGPGVRDEVRNTLFQPFVTTKPHGAGLGLYVCRQIVERSGGTLGYETTPTGATFWCDLPAAEATAAAPDPDRS